MKKVCAVLLALALSAGLFAGCNMVETDDDNVVIATVNGVSILKKDFNEVYNYYYYMYTQYYGQDASSAASALESQKAEILDTLIQQELVRQQAEAAGYLNYDDAARAEAQKTVDEQRNEYVDSLVESYKTAFEGQTLKGKNEGESDEDYFKRIATEKYYQQLEDNGTSEEEMLNEQLEQNALQKFQEDKVKDVTVTEADLMDAYNTKYNEQKEAIADASSFVQAYNQDTYHPMILSMPGYSKVMHILIKFDDTSANTLQGYYTQLNEYDEQIADYESQLLADGLDETAKADLEQKLEQAKTERADIQTKYDEALTAAEAAIQEKTDGIYAAVKDGDEAAFIKALLENSEDTGMADEETAKKGYLVGPSDGMVSEFSAAACALEVGKVSEPVASFYGYHIIRSIEKLPEDKFSFESVKDHLEEDLKTEKKDTEWNKMIEEWEKGADIKRHENKL